MSIQFLGLVRELLVSTRGIGSAHILSLSLPIRFVVGFAGLSDWQTTKRKVSRQGQDFQHLGSVVIRFPDCLSVGQPGC